MQTSESRDRRDLVAMLAGKGWEDWRIARVLVCSERSVRHHRLQLRREGEARRVEALACLRVMEDA